MNYRNYSFGNCNCYVCRCCQRRRHYGTDVPSGYRQSIVQHFGTIRSHQIKNIMAALPKIFALPKKSTYGVTDDFAVVAELGNQFDFKGLTNQEYNNDHNFDYKIGAKYNMQNGNWLAQVGGSYYTFNPKKLVRPSQYGFQMVQRS